MSFQRKLLSKLLTISVALFLSLLPGCSEDITTKFDEENRYWMRAKELYEKAKQSGEKVPDDIKDWIREDIKKIGTWEYKIVFLDAESNLEEELKKLGKERWECFWIERRENGLSLFLKRPIKSYLKAIPAKRLLKLIPQGGS